MINPAIWFPTVKTNSGTDVFTEILVKTLQENNIRAEITWLPHHSEYLPWLIKKPTPPKWANIVHINSWLHPRFIPKDIPLITNIHLCIQDPSLLIYKTSLQNVYHKYWITPIERETIKKSQKIIAVSKYTAEKSSDYFNNESIEFIYNGVDTKIFAPNTSKKKHQKFRLFFCGNISTRKGFDLLPKIMKKLGPQYELLYTSNQGKVSNLPNNMHHLPRLKYPCEIANIYQNVDALLFPTRLEGFGLVVAEAMSCSIPAIVSNNSSLPEIINDKVDGFLCEQDNIDDFVQTIQYLKNNPEIYYNISNQAREKIIRKFSIDEMVNKYIDIYIEILNSKVDL